MSNSRNNSDLSKKVNSRLQRIANVLLLNASLIDNPGLLNGKMGIAIFFYNYACCSGREIFEDYAGDLIDEIYEEINTSTPVDFENGLKGIGWGIEYLVKNGFVEANTDEVLADIDESLCKSLLAGINRGDIEDNLLYIISRFKHGIRQERQYDDLRRDSLILLLKECEKILLNNNYKEMICNDNSALIDTIRNLKEDVKVAGLSPGKIDGIRKILPHFRNMKVEEIRSEDKSIKERSKDEVWEIITHSERKGSEPDTISLFQSLFNYIDIEENWITTLNSLNNDNTGINKGLAGIGFALLHLASFYGLTGENKSDKDLALTNHLGDPSLFIFKCSSRGMKYGMGTYIDQLTKALLNYTTVNIFLVSYNNSNGKEYSVEPVSERYVRINIPAPIRSFGLTNQSEVRYGSVVVRFLSQIIPITGDVVFQMNYIDDLSILKKLKERYKNRVISMVHFAQWQQLFNGNKQKLKGLNIDNPSNNIEFTLSREKEMYVLSDHIVSVTRYMKDFLINEYGIRSEKIDVIPNGLNPGEVKVLPSKERQDIKRALGFGVNEKIILFTGRIDACKGIFFLIDGFCEACKKSDDLRLVIIGQGEMQACLTSCLSYYGRITFTGFLPKDKLQEFYQVADIGIVPSVYDHCPYSVLEMIDSGIPLILSGIDGLNEILDDGKCLFIYPVTDESGEISFDKKEIADLILSLSDDTEKRRRLTTGYRELIGKKFSGERMAKDMYRLINKLCAVSVET